MYSFAEHTLMMLENYAYDVNDLERSIERRFHMLFTESRVSEQERL